MHVRNMGMSFFVVCPLRNCECKAPKIGMNCNQSLIILFPFDSSRFSGQTSKIYKGIPRKDISMFHAKKDISMLLAIASFSGDIGGLSQFQVIIVYSRYSGSFPIMAKPATYLRR